MNTPDPPRVIALVGPTAVGKTELSLRMAERFNGEIISVDSMQVYRHMDIGTAKASPTERQRVHHHLIDIVDPDDEYNVARFIADALAACEKIEAQGRFPFLVGGTGLYLRGVTEGVFEIEAASEIRQDLSLKLVKEGREALYLELLACDPDTAHRIHPNDTHRLLRALEIFRSTGRTWSAHLAERRQTPRVRTLAKIGLWRERQELYRRIEARTLQMMEEGLPEEVEGLVKRGYGCGLAAMQSIGYRHICKLLAGEWTRKEAVEMLVRDTRRYAKRQLTWFRRDKEIHWFAPEEEEQIFALVQKALSLQ